MIENKNVPKYKQTAFQYLENKKVRKEHLIFHLGKVVKKIKRPTEKDDMGNDAVRYFTTMSSRRFYFLNESLTFIKYHISKQAHVTDFKIEE